MHNNTQQQLSEAIETRSLEALQRLIDDPQCDLNAPLGIDDGDCNAAAAALHCVLRPPKDICGSEGPLWKDTSTQMVGMLLAGGRCDVNVLDSHGRTPLHYAAIYRLPEVARLLIEDPKCDLNVADLPRGYTALHLSTLCAPSEADGESSTTVFDMLLNCAINGRCDINAITGYAKETILHLINDLTLLHRVLSNKRFSNYNQQNAKGYTALRCRLMAFCGPVESDLAAALIQSGRCDLKEVDPTTGNNLIHEATQRGRLKALTALLSNTVVASKAYINAKNKEGEAPIHLIQGPAELKVLMANPLCDVNQKGPNGLTRFQTDIRNGDTELVQCLLGCKRCALDIRDTAGNTALHLAACDSSYPYSRWMRLTRAKSGLMLRILLTSGFFDPNAVNKEGQTPLMILLTQFPSAQRVATLLQFGASVSMTDKRGRNIIFYAARPHSEVGFTPLNFDVSTDKDAFKLLLDAGADTSPTCAGVVLKELRRAGADAAVKLLEAEGVTAAPISKDSFCSVM